MADQKLKIKNEKLKMKKGPPGQVILEFTFCFIILMLILYGVLMAFRWAGLSLAIGRKSHEDTLTRSITEDWSSLSESPFSQVETDFYKIPEMNMIFNQWQ